MEHRCCRRQALDLKALIYKRGFPVAIGRIKNGSHQGLFITTDYTDVHENQKLELVVSLRYAPKHPKSYHLKTLVVHKANGGLGLELEVYDEKDVREMFELIKLAKLPEQQQDMRETG